MSSEITDAEVLAFIKETEAAYPPGAVDCSIAEQRAFYDALVARFSPPRPPDVHVQDEHIPRPGGEIPVRHYLPNRAGGPLVLYFHGGGFVVGGLESHDSVCAELAAGSGLRLVSVDYRLCPEHPHPAAFVDALAAVDHFSADRLIVAGDSAGGNLAAAVALARPHSIIAQVLIYPGLGGETLGLLSYDEQADAPLLGTKDVLYYKRIRAGGKPPEGDPTFSPLEAQDLSRSPPCFVSVAAHDPLRDDGPEYVRRLIAAGVQAEVVVETDLPHGHLRARHCSARAGQSFGRIIQALQDFATVV